MKRLIILITALAAVVFAAPVSAKDFDPYMIQIGYTGAPDDTAYVDILVKLPADDPMYTDMGAQPRRIKKGWLDDDSNAVYEYENLLIDPDDEIVKYDTDGYVSLTCHHRCVRLLTINTDGIGGYYSKIMQQLELTRDMGINITDIYEKYGDLKAAFVDEHGNILKVTELSRTEYNNSEPYAFIVNGDKLTLRLFGSGDKSEMTALVKAGITAAGIMAVLGVAAAVSTFVSRRKKRGEDR